MSDEEVQDALEKLRGVRNYLIGLGKDVYAAELDSVVNLLINYHEPDPPRDPD